MLAMDLMAWLGMFLFVVIWILIAFWPARVAGRKGHSFIGYFILSLIFFPLALIMAYAVHDRRQLA
jgi:hypothetical protein